MSSAPRRVIGGYIDRNNLDKAIQANADMTHLVLQISAGNVAPGLAVQLMRIACLLNEQHATLREMLAIRPEA